MMNELLLVISADFYSKSSNKQNVNSQQLLLIKQTGAYAHDYVI